MNTDSSSGWRRYNIFISSTFKDMDFERDVIKFRVIPELNRLFRDRRVELQAIDLRLGVNTSNMTEEESERKVLSVCTNCIDSARPFFLGLIGHRYGWIPPVERWKEFVERLNPEEREILAGTAGCSVTEMEIVYGALSQGSFDSSHVLFYLRDDASYEGLPADLVPAFRDTDPALQQKLDDLKERVCKLFGERGGEDDRCTPYHLSYVDGHFEGNEFERLVTEQLAEQIELETAREDAGGESTWWAQEKELEESTLLQLLPVSIETELYDDTEEGEASDDEEEDDASDRVVWYVPGVGASTHMAQEYAEWDGDADVVRLLAVFGLSQYSSSMRSVLARWIHELAEVCGRQDLPSEEELLVTMPAPAVNDLFCELVEAVREQDKYIYIYMDDVEALEETSAKDLYMPWLDRVADDVNVLINLQDESEARKKFLSAHPDLSRKMLVGISSKDEAEQLIAHYEQLYYLELPDEIRRDMLKIAQKKVLLPIQVHSVFRFFESLTQEDFRQIRSQEGNQIDAINSYLREIWKEMPDTSYEIMTFMVNNILANLGLGENWESAFWTLAAAPSGLRESDIAHFVGDDWNDVEFYRAMNFLQDFFYEDQALHLWRAKYITSPDDGLQEGQKAISEYILTLEKGDSLRETMGLYYALKSGDPSHYPAYMVEGDYLHGQKIDDLVRFNGPQIRQLRREGFFASDDFARYARALPAASRVQLFMQIVTGLADLFDEREEFIGHLADLLDDIDVDSLSAEDAFSFAGIMAFKRDSIPHLERALQAARKCAEAGFENGAQMATMLSGLLAGLYQQKGKRAKAEALRQESAASEGQRPKDRFATLFPILQQARACSPLFQKKKQGALLDSFFEQYYAIAYSLESDVESGKAVVQASSMIIHALDLLSDRKDYQRLLEEWMRYKPTMSWFYRANGFFDDSGGLQLFVSYHYLLSNAALGLLGGKPVDTDEEENPMQAILELAFAALSEGALKLKELDPDNQLVSALRSFLSGEKGKELQRNRIDMKGMSLGDFDEIIEEEYQKYKETL